MKPSKHNIISEIYNSDKFFIVNLLSQEADIISKEEADELLSGNIKNPDKYLQQGYIVNQVEEEKLYKRKYLEFIDTRETDEVQIFFVPTYACNFSCSYCYQDEYSAKNKDVDNEVVDAFFEFVDTQFAERKKYITIFGGEPLLNTEKQKNLIEYLILSANVRNLDIAVVTNGYHLEEYIPFLKKGNIREVQVTLDGVAESHNSRRSLKGNQPTFEKIVRGVDLALENNIPINLRMVVDKENINSLPELAKFAINKSWTNSPLFKTQLGRNYELHYCQTSNNKLYNRIDLYKDIYTLLQTFPYIEEFHRPAFSVSKFLFDEGELPTPLFDSCPGTKTEWAFDYTGKIYSCTATVGKPGEELGTYYPNVYLDSDKVEEWEERDVLSIKECVNCELQLACGGGCGSVSKNQTGRICSPDCRPVKELLELGISHYFKD